MTTLHVLRSKPDGQVFEIIRATAPGEIEPIALYEEVVDYDRLVEALFRHDRVISWW